MECPRCNEHLYRGMRFCPACGLCVEDLDLSDSEQETEDESSSIDDTLDLHLPTHIEHDAAVMAEVAEAEDDADASSANEVLAGEVPEAVESAEDEGTYSNTPFPEEPLEEEAQPESKGFSSPARPLVAKHTKAWVVVVVVSVLILVIAGAWVVHNVEVTRLERERLEAEERARNTPHAVQVGLALPHYNEESDSTVPIRVVGTTVTNKQVDEINLLRPSTANLNLLPGSYTVSLAGNPVTADGRLLRGSTDSFEVVISDGLSDEEEQAKSSNPVFAFEEVAPESVSDSDIDAVRQWMEGAGVENFQAYVDALMNLREQELGRISAEQEEREAEEMSAVAAVVRKVEQQLQELQKKKSAESKSSSSSSESSSSSSSSSSKKT